MSYKYNKHTGRVDRVSGFDLFKPLLGKICILGGGFALGYFGIMGFISFFSMFA